MEVIGLLEQTSQLQKALAERGLIRETYGFGGFLLAPQKTKSIDLLILTLVHGNEPGGVAAVNSLLQEYLLGRPLTGSIGVLICNQQAAAENKRFLEKDLNRCFGKVHSSHEGRRAQEIEPLILRSKFLLDIHQTNYETKSDFFIFPESESNIKFAISACPETPIITHGLDFSDEGLTSDTFATLKGVTAITYEMGQIGRTGEQVEKTLRIIKRSIDVSVSGFSHTPVAPKILKFAQKVTAANQRRLIPNLTNFTAVKKGEVLGFDPNGSPFYAEHDGYVVFPKYGELAEKSSELCHLVT